MDQLKQRIAILNKEAEHIPILHEFSRKINQPPALVILGVLAILLLVILFGFAGGLLTTVIGVVYPSFKSIQALESKSDSEDDKQWLTYWIIYGVFIIIDEFGGFVLQMIPFYHFGKVCFLIWLFNPATLGAAKLYNGILKPFIKKHEGKIDKVFKEVDKMSKELNSKKDEKYEESK